MAQALLRLGGAFAAVALVGVLVQLPATGGSRPATVNAFQTPSPTPTQTSTPTPTPNPRYREVSLTASRRKVRVGERITLRGRVQANQPSCSANSTVLIRRLIFGSRRHLEVATVTAEPTGEFKVSERVRWSSVYSAVARRSGSCGKRTSDPEPVFAHVWFSVKVSDARPKRFTNFRVHGRVRPHHGGSKVVLQEFRAGRWRTLQSGDLSPQSSFSFFPVASWKGKHHLRLRWPQADRDHEAGISRVLTITTHG
ncbi:MAG TPA: hypothetical protein VE174_08755 [Actinomycetota bacterium]|nr:hypothetical protein [Actinomycetota bacterium]